MIERFDGSEGLGAIFPPMVWSIVALKCLGYRDDSAEVAYCHEHLDGLIIEDEDSLRLQPCKSPVWDTAITLRALAASGVDASSRRRARRPVAAVARKFSDTAIGPKRSTPSRAAGASNMPTSFIPMSTTRSWSDGSGQSVWRCCRDDPTNAGRDSLPSIGTPTSQPAHQRVNAIDRVAGSMQRALDGCWRMQNRDGGWGAFDRNNDREFLCHVPFADHNAMIDPSTPDLAGRVLESLGHLGRRVGEPDVDRAVAYIRSDARGRRQLVWPLGRELYLRHLAVARRAGGRRRSGRRSAMMVAAPTGCWPISNRRAAGANRPTATPSPTARTGTGHRFANRLGRAGPDGGRPTPSSGRARGIRYLWKRSRPTALGTRREFTGTGFPQVFYLRYHYYPIYFPLLALTAWAKHVAARLEEAETLRQRLVETTGESPL